MTYKPEMPAFALIPAENGGWIVQTGGRYGEPPKNVAAFSDDADMMSGIDSIVAAHRNEILEHDDAQARIAAEDAERQRVAEEVEAYKKKAYDAAGIALPQAHPAPLTLTGDKYAVRGIDLSRQFVVDGRAPLRLSPAAT